MKKVILLLFGICLLQWSCEVEPVAQQEELQSTAYKWNKNKHKKKKIFKGIVVEADRCSEDIPDYNFWWYQPTIPFVDQFFASSENAPLTYTEYDDGTINVKGITNSVSSTCMVEVDLWLKDRKTWDEWQAAGGEFKDETADGACSGAVADDQSYYVIDGERSFINIIGDCYDGAMGKYRLLQRPDPNDPDTPKYGAVIGPGGAIWDSNEGALGLSTWATIADMDGNGLYLVDFNFLIKKKVEKIKKCVVVEADRCSEDIPDYNFWWYQPNIPFVDQFFASSENAPLTYTEYDDGTINVKGITNSVSSTCMVKVDLWLKDRKTWDEWQAAGGEFKDETADGACSGAVAEDQSYYVIDGERSFIKIRGDCYDGAMGKYRLLQRPDPNDPDTPKYGAVIGPGGAIWDSNEGALGLSTWATIADMDGNGLYLVDFNFLIDCDGNNTCKRRRCRNGWRKHKRNRRCR